MRITRTRRKFCQLPMRSKHRHSVLGGRLHGLVARGPAAHTVPAISGSAGLDLGKLECCWTRRNGMSGRRPLVGWRSLPLKHAGGLVNRPLFLDATVRIFPGHGAPNQLDSATAIPSSSGSWAASRYPGTRVVV